MAEVPVTAPRPLRFDPYEPWRRTLLSPAEVRELSLLSPWRPLRDIALNWVIMFAAWTTAAMVGHWLAVLLAIPVIGNRYYALFIIGHDGLHRRVMPSRMWNDLVSDLLIFGVIGAITRINNQNHLRHHQLLASEEDPDRHRHGCFNKSDIAETMLFLTGLATVAQSFRNVFAAPRASSVRVPGPEPARSAYQSRDVAIIAACQAALIGGLTLTFGWWGYPLLWLVPVGIFTILADNFRSFAEHGHAESDTIADGHRLITYTSNAFERALVAPMNMNYHAAHHLWVGIPYYNLPVADALIRARAGGKALVWRSSYSAFLWRYLRSLPIDACRQPRAGAMT